MLKSLEIKMILIIIYKGGHCENNISDLGGNINNQYLSLILKKKKSDFQTFYFQERLPIYLEKISVSTKKRKKNMRIGIHSLISNCTKRNLSLNFKSIKIYPMQNRAFLLPYRTLFSPPFCQISGSNF